MANYNRLDVAFERGDGVYLWDTGGRQYIDALSGIAVCSLGHAHPRVTAAVADQAGRLVHTSNLYQVPLQQQLGDRLTDLAGMDRVFFCNSGAEANEAAIKITRLHARQKDISDPLIIATEGSFHGRTMATLSATGSPKARIGFEPLVPGFRHVPYGDDAAVARAIEEADGRVVAVMLESVQGEGGINVPPAGYLARLRELTTDSAALMMMDEVQAGMCRSGRWFGYQHDNIIPDVVTLAKALGNGVPIGACMARGAAAGLLVPGSHGSTFGGNPLACSAALAVLDVMQQERLDERAARIGSLMLEGFRQRLGGNAAVVDVRGKGLLLGIELDRPCGDLVRAGLAAGVLLNVTAGCVVRLLPPLVIPEAVALEVVDRVSLLIEQFIGSAGAAA
ncbi:MAG: aspartate aminotransferase family protein [Gammaproteobacteria bacterium]|nr:aspartate aminotransferase family protein [Gammaproteobacteria bacterium]